MKVGAHSSRPLRWVGTMLLAVRILTPLKSHAVGSILPALAKSARAGHPYRRGAYEVKSLGHPPRMDEGRKRVIGSATLKQLPGGSDDARRTGTRTR